MKNLNALQAEIKKWKDFLEQRTKMPEFLNSVCDVVDISVADYIKRGFSNLMVGFGCTGGQHRSVYAADALARHLKNKFGVNVELSHKVQEEKIGVIQLKPLLFNEGYDISRRAGAPG